MKTRDIPNIISIMRMVLVIPVIWLLLQQQFQFALLLFTIAGISDGLDGYLAKRNAWHSRLGSILDPLADKLLLVGSYIALSWLQLIPVWLLATVIIRDVLIVSGGVAYHYLIGRFNMEPSWASKTNTFFQIVLVLAVIFSEGFYPLPPGLITVLIYTVLATVIASGAGYIYHWGKRGLQSRRDQ